MASLKKILCLSPARCLTTIRAISTQGSVRYAGNKDEVTHTGQHYEPDDYRNVRFTNSAKIVNKKWAIDLIAEAPVIQSTSRVVACDGGDQHLGHPKVYINLDKPGVHSCGYCGLRYEKKDDHHH